MRTSVEIRADIEKLEHELREALQQERQSAREQILTLMKATGMTLADIENLSGKANKLHQAPRATRPAKYRNPVDGRTWSGQGRTPLWMGDRDKEEFRIPDSV